jgi:hypothetical protein
MYHPAKAGHPGWQHTKGWRCDPRPPTRMGWKGWQVQTAMDIRMGWISLLHSLWSTQIVTRRYEHVFKSLREALIVATYDIWCNTRRCVRNRAECKAVKDIARAVRGAQALAGQLTDFGWTGEPPEICAFRCQGNHGGYRDRSSRTFYIFTSSSYDTSLTFSSIRQKANYC